MADLQLTQEVVVCLNSFHNVDLFQRGFYQVRCRVEEVSKVPSFVECEVKEKKQDSRAAICLFKPFIDKYTSTGISKTIEVYYKQEEVQISDIFTFQVHILIDSSKIESQLPLKLQLVLDLYFAESSRSPVTPRSLEHASTQILTLHLSAGEPFHAYRPVLFDYFHFAAVTLTIHSCVLAFRQPWSSALKSLHPIWSGKSGHIRQYTYNSLFGKSSSGIQPSQKLERRHKENASYMHRKLCLQLLKRYENLLSHYHAFLPLLPDYVQMKLSNIDVEAKLEVLNSELNSLVTAEETYLRMGDDLYLLSTELNMLWTQFSEQFIFENVLEKQLIDEHHMLRTEHMREALFTRDHPWQALVSSLEMSTSQQARMFSGIKSSLYYQLIPPINLECPVLDGDCATMPIIFEDKYIPGKKDTNCRLMSVEESLVGDDFVDVNVQLEDSKHGDLSNEEDSLFDEHVTAASCIEKHHPKNSVGNDADEAWGLSKDKIELLSRETDITGPEYCPASSHEYSTGSANTDSIGLNFKSRDVSITKCKNPPILPSSTFYADLEHDPGVEPEVADDALLIEDLEIGDDEDESKTKQIIALSNEQYSNSDDPIDGTSCSARPRPKLWSCFPTKGGSMNRSSPYKSSSAQSLQYTPLARQLSARRVTDEREQHILRFQMAKENLVVNCDTTGCEYRLKSDEIHVKPYFTEHTVATTENVHLVVCVHGLDGNSGDLRLVRCFLEMALPGVNFDFLMSEINQEDTFCDIDEMTERLVEEILDYIEEQSLDVVKLSFVGHSLGNIIIRNAVTHSSLYLFRNKLYTFLSLSGPHLGMQYHTSNLVSTGMWLMQKWKKEGSLVQLALNDTSDPRESFMYRLSLTNGFQYFKNVLLVSSVQDHYVPFHSARIEMSKSVAKDNTEVGRVYKEMLDHILGPLMAQEEVNIVKYSVHHPMPSSPNTFIGRAAHIAMLDSELFLEKFILCVGHQYFE